LQLKKQSLNDVLLLYHHNCNAAIYCPVLRGVLGKSGCCEEECKTFIIRDADGARHPDRNPDHKRSELKPWLYAVGVKLFILYFPELLII
jgi:hypothetical protein